MTTKDFLNDWLTMFDIKPTEIDNCRFTSYQMERFAEAYHQTKAENLPISGVSQQREQLIDFSMKRNKAPKDYRPQYEKEVDEYLKSINCG